MNFTLDDQLQCALAFFICGMFLGVLYDILKILRTEFFTGRAFVFVCDVLFMIIFALCSVVLSMAYSFGQIRYFAVFSQFCGVFVVRFTIGRLSVKFLGLIFRKIALDCKKILIKSKKIAKRVLQPMCNLLYNKVKKRSSVPVDSTDSK